MSKKVILTGIRANNDLHIGNYFGALLPLIDMAKSHADDYEVNLFVPDLHSFTTPIDHDKLFDQTMHNLKAFAAAGLPLDSGNIHVYRQSFIPAHSELTWILDCFTGFSEMRRMTQFKDKSKVFTNPSVVSFWDKVDKNYPEVHKFILGEEVQDRIDAAQKYHELMKDYQEDRAIGSKDEVSVGLFNYPVLMAADILLYGASYVPVGDDQTQHLEFARDIAERMNTRFGELFVVPEPVKKQHEFFGKEQGLRIKDLADPAKKMAKSDETGKGVIFMGDEPAAAAKKIMSATTDSLGQINFDFDKQPGVSNLLQIYELLGGDKSEFVGQAQYGSLKQAVANKMSHFLESFQVELARVDEKQLLAKLESDEEAMNEKANATLFRVQRAVGLRPKS